MTTSDEERYEFAEPNNGCFIPRSGDQARSMELLKTAASWYGAKIVPGDWKPEVRLVMNWTPEMTEAMRRMAAEIKRRHPRPGELGPS